MPNKGLLATRLANQKQSEQTNSVSSDSVQNGNHFSQNNETQTYRHFAYNQQKKHTQAEVEQKGVSSDFFKEEQWNSRSSTTEEQAKRQELSEEEQVSKWRLSTRIINILLVVSCVYVLFLIYGVSVTDYQYSNNGTIEAQKLSVRELADKKAYETVYYQYLHLRSLYEVVLLLDYRIGKGEEEPLTIAPEYEALLDDVTNLSVKTEAMEVESQYSQIKNIMLLWVKNDIAVYLQNMSAAISQNDVETANKAIQDKERVYKDFSIITQNIVAMGESVKGADLTEIREWTPESYVDEKINGK